MTLQRVGGSQAPDVKCPACGARTAAGVPNCQRCGSVLAKTKRHPHGTALGAYILEDVLGEGTMGIVYLAKHARLGRRVAIKVLRSEYGDNPQAIRRFFAEARAVNKIAHPNIVEVTDFVERPGEDNYYVMELLEGASLAVLLDAGGVPALARSYDIMKQLADALAAVHDAGIVHRDLKPDNVLLIEKAGKTDFVKLCDFGVAKLMDSTEDRVSMHGTSQGAILGTPEYMSPEQASGKAVDHRSDIYSYGVMMYQLATGRVPFKAPDFGEMVVQLLKSQPTPPSKLPNLPHAVPASLEALIMRCLAKNPMERPPSMEWITEQLEKIGEEQDWLVYELESRGPSSRASGQMPRVHERAATDRPIPQTPPPLPVVQPPVVARRPRVPWPVIAAAGAALAIVVMALVLANRMGSTTSAPSKVDQELAIADERIAAGRLVAPGGDEALDHLLAARALDPKHPGIAERMQPIARKFEELAEQALAAGSLAEAAAHFETVLLAEPDNARAKQKLADIEAKMLEQQRK